MKAVDNLKKIPVIKFIHDKDTGEKYYETSLFYYDKILKLARFHGYDVSITEFVDKVKSRLQEKTERIQKQRDNVQFSSPLWTDEKESLILPFQAKAINTIFAAKRFLLGDDMGAGKTAIALGIICYGFDEDYNKALIVVPNRIKYQWKSEIQKFTKINESEIGIVDLNAKKEYICPIEGNLADFRCAKCRSCKKFEKCKRRKYDTRYMLRKQLESQRIIICNYEILDKLKDKLISGGFDIMILDEATRIKNMNTKVCKAVMEIRKNLDESAIVVPMSGTFIENKLEEIYPAMFLVNKHIFGDFGTFKRRYMEFDYWGNVVGYKKQKFLKRIIDKWIIRRSIAEVWKERPPLVETTKVCEMTKEQRKIYDDAFEGVLKNISDLETQNKINFAEIGALINYLLQICDSAETLDSKKKESGKLDVLKEIVSEEIASNHKVLIFSFFANKVIPIIKREMKKYGKCLVITGNTKPEEAEVIKNKFNKKKKYRFLICSDSMAYGANLQSARYVINFDLPWNPAKLDQRIRRVYRKGLSKS